MSRKLGILGGTFNPIHYGHLLLAENAYWQLGLDEVWFLPSHIPPHKPRSQVLHAEKRIEMIRLAIQNVPYFSLSLLEMEREGVNYTADTLATLKAEDPERELFFLAGADSLYQIPTWKDPELIFSLCHFAAARRDSVLYPDLEAQAQLLREQFSAKVDLIDLPEVDISSHLIRERRAKGQSIRFLVPEAVERYLRQVHAYENPI